MTRFLKRFGVDGFILALIVAVLVAWLFPQLGTMKKPFSLSAITDFGIAGIFFFYGLRLHPAKMKEGASNWKLHLLIQCTTFILFPILILAAMQFFPHSKGDLLWLGIFYVAALPSTVSSSVIMVSIAKGNIPAAIFNASLSSLLGVFITPFWMRLFLTNVDHNPANFQDVFLKLCLQVILPLLLGMFLNRYWGRFAEKWRKVLNFFEKSVIVLIVYNAFSNSFVTGVFSDFGILTIIYVIIGMVLLFFITYFIMKACCKAMKFSTEDVITATFCGSKKSLVHGSAMSKILFPGISAQGLVLMPIMIYHITQLLIVGVIANKFSQRDVPKH